MGTGVATLSAIALIPSIFSCYFFIKYLGNDTIETRSNLPLAIVLMAVSSLGYLIIMVLQDSFLFTVALGFAAPDMLLLAYFYYVCRIFYKIRAESSS
mmetsp:Transcript_42757/g.65711  ORF Transcript_42757/g.65711 Transcript_42757/m.65711 type:complete len:98 (-) Transcript_42757:69-362(-)